MSLNHLSILLGLITVLSGIAGIVHAEESTKCDPVETTRLDAPGLPFSKIPIRDQGDLGTCYAVTAAQMMDYWRLKHAGINKKTMAGDGVSDIYAALLYAEFKSRYLKYYCPESLQAILEMPSRERVIDGGSSCETLELLLEKGACSQVAVEHWMAAPFTGPGQKLKYGISHNRNSGPELESPIYATDLLNQFYEPEYLKSFCIHRYLAKTNDCASCSQRVMSIGDTSLLLVKDLAKLSLEQRTEALEKVHLQIEEVLPQARTELEILEKIKKTRSELDQNACAPNQRIELSKQVPRFSCESVYLEEADRSLSSEQVEKRINQQLKNLNPVGIGYCSGAIRNQKFERSVAEENGRTLPPDNGHYLNLSAAFKEKKHPLCGPHASILIGSRKCRNGRKEFLLRNSWGTEWCKEEYARLEGSECDGGDLWIDAEVMSQNIRSFFVLDEAPSEAERKIPLVE